MGSVTWHFCQLSESESGRDLFSCSVISPVFKYPQCCCTTYSCLLGLQLVLQNLSRVLSWVKQSYLLCSPYLLPGSVVTQSHQSNPIGISKSIEHCRPLRVYSPLAVLPHSLFVLYSHFYIYRFISVCFKRRKVIVLRLPPCLSSSMQFECYFAI